LKKFTQFGAALMMLIPGILYLFAPQIMLNTPQIHLNTVNEFHSYRAAYGGGFLGIAALFAMGAFDRSMEKGSLWAIVLIFLGFAVGRIYSIVVDGVPTPLFLGVLVAETFLASCAMYSLKKNRK